MPGSYLFYDIETTGLNPCFDQVIQFAAIRTDLSLNEIERHEIKVKLNDDIVPTPDAILTHRVGIEAMQQGQLELNAISEIHKLLNQSGTISLGYNTLGFDDEFLRFSFYRNLLAPYTHQFANQCRRMDIYPITVLYYLFSNNSLEWPIQDKKVSLKLDNLNRVNKFASGQAHDAMVDVAVTLALARELKKEEKIWQYACGYFDKKTDLDRLQALPYTLNVSGKEFQESLMVSGKLGQQNHFQAPVLSIGFHKHYRNQMLWLRLDQEDLQKVNETNITENCFVIRKRAGEQPLLLPPKDRFLVHLTEDRKKIVDENRLWLKKNPELLDKIINVYQHHKYPVNPNTDCQAALYETNFPSPYAEKIYQEFHSAEPEQKSQLINQFDDEIRKELAYRLIGRFYPQYMTEENKIYYKKYQQQLNSNTPPQDFRFNSQFTKKCCSKRLTELKDNNHMLDAQQKELLFELGCVFN